MGRFVQEDPIGTAGGINVYVFAGDDPVSGSDPSGLRRDEDWCADAGGHRDAEAHCVDSHGGGVPQPIGGVTVTATRRPDPFAWVNSPSTLGGWLSGAENGVQLGVPTTPSRKSAKTTAACGLKAWKQNWKGLVLDGTGWAVVAAFPKGSLAATVAGSTLGVVGIGVAVADNRGRADGVVSGTLAYAGKQAAVVEGGFRGTAAAVSATSMIAHRFGLAALYFSTAYDTYKYTSDFNACRAGH